MTAAQLELCSATEAWEQSVNIGHAAEALVSPARRTVERIVYESFGSGRPRAQPEKGIVFKSDPVVDQLLRDGCIIHG